MNKLNIKICGLTRWQDVKAAANLGADYLGFINAKESLRYVSIEQIADFIYRLRRKFPSKKAVVVTTCDNKAEIEQIYSYVASEYIQIHNDMDADTFNSINIENRIKVFRVKEKMNLKDIQKYKASYFLFDTYQKDKKGGTGEVFPWEYLPSEILPKSFIAGGITPENVTDLLSGLAPKNVAEAKVSPSPFTPYGLDISSGVEESPGIKDPSKLRQLFRRLG